MSRPRPSLPVIDISRPPEAVAAEIEAACRASGFFYVAGHGVPAARLTRLEAAARAFFALPLETKYLQGVSPAARADRL